jgi:uncharacterized membrane protein YdjX (TVP38/TMEM64 family)
VRVSVHSKVLIVDGRFVRVGSANLSNRSLGLDTECDLAIDAAEDGRVEHGIGRFRARLLAEHLGVTPERMSEAIAAHDSLIAAVEALRGGARDLVPLECPPSAWLDTLVPDGIDPESPVDPDRLIEEFVPSDVRRSIHHPILRAGMVLLALALVVALGTHVLQEAAIAAPIAAWSVAIREHALAPVWVLAAFVAGGLVLVPVSLLLIGTVLLFGGATGAVYALLGITASAAVTYGLGRALGRDAVRRLAGKRLNRLSGRLVRRGARAIAATRLLAIAPFTVTNVVAGASRVPLRDYMLGTFLGTLPGVVVTAAVTSGLGAVVPGLAGSAAALTAIGALLALAGAWLRRHRPERALRAGSSRHLGWPGVTA